LPVVTSRYNGVGELMTEGVEGFVLPDPADVDQLTAHLEMLLDAGLRERMGEAARQLALRNTFAQNVDKMLDVYREMSGVRRYAA
jgi:glycosyltransferase involved in cell wall biosynthesis